jgi:hypothetical protein
MPLTPQIRLLAIASLGGVAVTHLMDLPHKLMEAPYLAVLFCALITASTLLSLAMVSEGAGRLALLASGALGALAIAGYVLSRSVGLPMIEDHVGDWLAPAGVASLLCEGVLVVLALRVLGAPSEDQVVAHQPLQLAVLEQQRQQGGLELLPQLPHLREQR